MSGRHAFDSDAASEAFFQPASGEGSGGLGCQLELGRDGKHLRQLAGILGNESPSEIDDL
jgi:hypothetical protein